MPAGTGIRQRNVNLEAQSSVKETIVQIIGNGDPGGGTTAVLTLATMLHAEGYQSVVVSQRDSYLLNEAARIGIEVYGFDFSSRRGAIANLFGLARFIRQRAPGVVHAHGNRAGLPTSLAMALLHGPVRPRFVYTVHGFHFLSKKHIVFLLARLAERFCIARADRTNFVSQGDARIAQTQRMLADPSRTRVIHNAVLAADFPEQRQFRAEPGIAFIGRLTYQKNPLILPDIVAALGAHAPRVHVIGGGDLEHELKAKVQAMGLIDRFVFHGQQPRPATLAIAGACSLLLLPSRWEGHPITVIEAMHMGLPVVASNVSGTKEIVDAGKTGYLVDTDDVAGYAAAISRIQSDAAHARMLGDAGRRMAQTMFSPERMLAANLDGYRRPVPGGAAPCAGASA
jgi:glycosyltransferase involved in cell wall biosynthesis